MNILHFSTSDIGGGAAKAAHRLHSALRASGHCSQMIVREKLTDDETVIAAPIRRSQVLWRRAVTCFIPGYAWYQQHDFNPDLPPPVDIESALAAIKQPVDIICLHWITGLLSSSLIAKLSMRLHCPLVIVLQDTEPMTGGCHYPGGCDGFTRQCGCCPQLSSKRSHDRSHVIWLQKQKHLTKLPVTLISGSSWLTAQLRKSGLWQQGHVIEIADPIDIQIFRPIQLQIARDLLHLPAQAFILFFGAFSLTNPRKGMQYLFEALKRLSTHPLIQHPIFKQRPLHLLVAGHHTATLLNSLPFPYTAVGYLRDEITLALCYQAADVFLCPSIEDAGPMMIPESMLCGTPVVAFDTGIAPDLLGPSQTGYLARFRDSADMAHGIATVLTEPQPEESRKRSNATALSYHDPKIVAAQHYALYQTLQQEMSSSRKLQ